MFICKNLGMSEWWVSFHDPDISWPVVRRQFAEELTDMIFGMGQLIASRGRMITHGGFFPSRDAAYTAKHRLKKKGLIAEKRIEGHDLPVLMLTPEGEEMVSASLKPYCRWNAKWKGRWYMLVYDVPERDRYYRDVLRAFLRKQKMGQLQRSVWVTPFDIRPLYNDLVDGSEAGDVSYLFEARTVLGLPSQHIVCGAWDMDRLIKIQSDFCGACEQNYNRLRDNPEVMGSLMPFVREAFSSYRYIMEQDPLLPRELWPKGYLGEQVYSWHRALQKRAAKLAARAY